MRLAMYGFVDRDAGSQSSAGYLLTKEMLRRGIEISFYAISGFVQPKGFEAEPGFQYIPIKHPIAKYWRVVERIPFRSFRQTTSVLFSQLSNRSHYVSIAERIRLDHANRPFDALFCNGLLCPFPVEGLRIVSWSQGCPYGEKLSIRSNARRIAQANPLLVPGLEGMYFLKNRQARNTERFSTKILCGSSRSREHWIEFGTPAEKLIAIPYPMDVQLFQAPPARAGKGVRFLHLGRIVPRKRIDLLIEAFIEFHKSHPDSFLEIAGRFGYASRLDRKLVLTPHPGIRYQEYVPRDQVAQLMSECDCVIQTSENEDFGSAVAEGLLCGRPAIVGPTNGMIDYVGPHSVTFDKYETHSVEKAMEEMASRLSNNRSLIFDDCRQRAVATFSVPHVCDQVLSHLRPQPDAPREN